MSKMQMLSREEETDTEVTWEDQKQINRFSVLTARLVAVTDLRAEKAKDAEALDDALSELEVQYN